jgi:hypothetical protein
MPAISDTGAGSAQPPQLFVRPTDKASLVHIINLVKKRETARHWLTDFLSVLAFITWCNCELLKLHKQRLKQTYWTSEKLQRMVVNHHSFVSLTQSIPKGQVTDKNHGGLAHADNGQ